jgi:hypothetical protein
LSIPGFGFLLVAENILKRTRIGFLIGLNTGTKFPPGGFIPMPKNALTDTRIKALKPKNKPYKVSDGTIGGLHVAVSTAGGKVFCLAYRFEDKWRLLRLGTYPVFSLDEARELAREAKKQLATGINPAAAKQAARTKAAAEAATFRVVAAQWLAWKQNALGAVTTDDTVKRLEKHVLPRLGDKPVAEAR